MKQKEKDIWVDPETMEGLCFVISTTGLNILGDDEQR
jgi:hypothetical protein